MSDQVNRIGTENRARATAPAPVRGPEPRPQDSQSKSRDDAASITSQPATSYGAMLNEVYDGDASEAMAVVAKGLRTGERRSVLGQPEDEPVDKRGKELARGRRNAPAQPIAPSRDRQATARRAHEQFVLAISKRASSDDIATFISELRFPKLEQMYRARPPWQRLHNASAALMLRQMRNTQEARAR